MDNSKEVKRQCGDCEYFYRKNESEAEGQCRRHAPQPGPTKMVTWPEVNGDSWCGEFYRKYQRADERKAMEAIYQPVT